MMVKEPISVKTKAMTIFGIRTCHLLCAINGMKNMAGNVPIPNASMESMDDNSVPLPSAFVNPR